MKKAIVIIAIAILFGIDFSQITDELVNIVRLPMEELNGG